MMKTILLPLDGSPLSERALTYATTLARRTGATIELLEAVQAHTLPAVDPTDAQLRVTEIAEAYLGEIARREAALGVRVTTHLYYDDAVHAILDAAQRLHADLIVMSTHGRSGLSRMLYGSVADQVLRRATVPVLLVPSIVEHVWPAEGPLSLLVPLDGSELAEEAIHAADLLTEAFGARLTLMRVIQPPTYPLYGDGYAYVPYDEAAEIGTAREYLATQAKLLERERQPVASRVAVGEPTRAIGEAARELDVDVVVMATHGAGGLSRLILGSIATGMLRHTTAPLLLVRPPAAGQRPVPHASVPEPEAAEPGETAAVTTANVEGGPAVALHLSASDLELIMHGLDALGFAPGYDYGHVAAARALASRLESSTKAPAHELVPTS